MVENYIISVRLETKEPLFEVGYVREFRNE